RGQPVGQGYGDAARPLHPAVRDRVVGPLRAAVAQSDRVAGAQAPGEQAVREGGGAVAPGAEVQGTSTIAEGDAVRVEGGAVLQEFDEGARRRGGAHRLAPAVRGPV